MSSTPTSGGQPGLAATVGWYTLARVGLVAVVAGVLVLAGVPLLIALLVGLIVALPLSMVLFRGLRERLDGALAEVRERRSAERAALRGRLRGDVADEPGRSEQGVPEQQPEPETERGER
jgi:membrane protein implicated in regulation of membrane protease activity